AVAAEEPTTQEFSVPLVVQTPEGRSLTRQPPALHAVFAGPARELFKLYATPPAARSIVPDTVVDSLYTLQISPSDVDVPKRVEAGVQWVEPRAVTVALQNIARGMVPVVSRVTVRPDSGFAIFGGIAVTPGSVLVVGPGARLGAVQQVATIPLDLTAVSG